MDLLPRERLVLAYLVAPLTTAPALAALVAVAASRELPWSLILGGLDDALFSFSMFGIPLAFLTELLLVVLVRSFGHRPATIRRRWIVALGSTAGALVFSLPTLGDPMFEALWTAGAGGAMGAVASTTFCLIRGPSRSAWAV